MRVWMCLFMLWRLGLQPALAQDRDYGRSMGVTGRAALGIPSPFKDVCACEY
jgi:hypothetical protein